VPVEEGGAANGDQLTCDIQETTEDGGPLPDRRYRNIQVELGKGQYGPQFDEQMQGARSGEERSIAVTNPDDDPDPEVAGRTEFYRVLVHEVKRAELAELDDEFAKEVPPGFDSLAELRTKVAEDLTRQLERSLEQDLNNRLIEQILERNPVEVPGKMIEAQLDAIIEQARAGTDNPIDEGIVKRSYREQVTRNLRWTLIARSIVKQEQLALTDEELDAEIERYAAASGQSPKTARLQLKRANALDRMQGELLDRKLMQFLRARATVLEDADAPESVSTVEV
jgi:trigger factor